MAQITFKGEPLNTKGPLPPADTDASDFRFVKKDMTEGKLSDYGNNVKVLIGVPSLDTGVCATEAKKFNEQLDGRKNTVGIVVSKDLPFAMGRFCENEGVDSVVTGSDFRYDEFTENYNTKITDGPLKGLSARAVFVVDGQNKIRYSELVPEIAQEPEYDKVLKAVDELI